MKGRRRSCDGRSPEIGRFACIWNAVSLLGLRYTLFLRVGNLQLTC